MSASMSFQITLDNTDKVGKELDEAVARALEICGGKAETYAKYRCPVRTGNLRNSITHKLASDGKSVDISSDVEYSVFVELGTRKMKAQPYLRPALENHMSEYKQIINNELST